MFRLRRATALRVASILVVAGVACAGLSSVSASPAQAVNPQDFNPGNIISDDLFYNGSAMTAAEIQGFLNQKVPRCIIGDPGYGAGTAHGSNTIASQCLRDYTGPTASKPSNAYCSAYAGSSRESAATIIEKVARACGISAKVLLVMLEKEQSLISDTWPYNRQFDVAMGYACPDSGPGNSANCDSAYYGFHNQVYRSAWQLKVYRGNPNSYRYKPFQTNTIQWHPNVGCGTSQVFIENWATAALYIYTPYRPNQAALNAGWGTGDGCSTYGNRNFFMFYESWFGSTHAAQYPAIDAKYAQNPWLGVAVTGYNFQSAGSGGYVRGYENGAIAWRQGTGTAFILTGDFRTYFGTQGGIAGRLGWPTSDIAERERGKTQAFEGGALSWTSEFGYATISGKIRTHYAEWGLAYSGPLGWPIADPVCTTTTNCTQDFEFGKIELANNTPTISIPQIDAVVSANSAQLGAITQSARAQDSHGGGFVQAHQNAAVTWNREAGAFILTGNIRKAFGAAGGIAGIYGWPVAEQACSADGSCSQAFVGGTISVDASGNVASMAQDVKSAYDALLSAGIDLGKSTGNTNMVSGGAGGRVHGFENGAIAVSDRTPASAVMAPVRAAFNAAGGLSGSLGWPTGNAISAAANGGGIVQGFEGGAITSTTAGTFLVTGDMRAAYNRHGGISGTIGWPAGNAAKYTLKGGGSVQGFQNAALTQMSGSGVVRLDGEIRRVFGEAGGLSGTPGWPTADARTSDIDGGGLVQGFQDAAITSSTFGTFMVSGEIRRAYNLNGGLSGVLGWPTGALTVTGDVHKQSFRGGVVEWNSKTGVAQVSAAP